MYVYRWFDENNDDRAVICFWKNWMQKSILIDADIDLHRLWYKQMWQIRWFIDQIKPCMWFTYMRERTCFEGVVCNRIIEVFCLLLLFVHCPYQTFHWRFLPPPLSILFTGCACLISTSNFYRDNDAKIVKSIAHNNNKLNERENFKAT